METVHATKQPLPACVWIESNMTTTTKKSFPVKFNCNFRILIVHFELEMQKQRRIIVPLVSANPSAYWKADGDKTLRKRCQS